MKQSNKKQKTKNITKLKQNKNKTKHYVKIKKIT